MSETEQNRSEQATPYKLMRSREKGVVARGIDLGYLAVLASFAAYVWFQGPELAALLAESTRKSLVAAPNVLSSPNELLWVTGAVLRSAVRPVAVLVAVVFVVVLLAELIQTGVVFSTEPLRLDFSRLSPTRGFKRVFSVRMLVETGKNVLKLAVYGVLAWLVIHAAQSSDIASLTDAGTLAGFMQQTGFRLLACFVGGAVVFAILDQLISRRDFMSKMRMSRREVRREARDREGDPRMKQRRRALHREFVNVSQSLKNIRGADVLITNPVHLAVALSYDPASMAAPKVVSRGANQMAQRLKRLAFIYGVVIIENKELARALYRGCAIDQQVPEALYRPVADAYLTIRDKVTKRRRALESV